MSRREELVKRVLALNEQMLAESRLLAAEEWPDLELTYPQLRVLGALAAGPKRMSDLVSLLGSQPSTMSVTVDRLVTKGLVQRGETPSDRRVVLCSLTSQGQATIEQFSRLNRLQFEEMADFLTDEELTTVVNTMEIIHNALKRMSRSNEGGAVGPPHDKEHSQSTRK